MIATCQRCLDPIHLDDDPRLTNAEWWHTGKPQPHRPEPVDGSIRMVEAAANSAG